MARDPFGRGPYPVDDPDAAWRRLRRVTSSQHIRVLEALRRSMAGWVEDEDEAHVGECETCDGAGLVIAELTKVIDVELQSGIGTSSTLWTPSPRGRSSHAYAYLPDVPADFPWSRFSLSRAPSRT
jgi:hypothetical protein